MNQDDAWKLRNFVQRWTAKQPTWHYRSSEQLAKDLAADADFAVLRFAGWLRTPDGELIATVVRGALPFPYNRSADVLIDAIKLAAGERTRRERLTVVGLGAVGCYIVFAFGRG